MRSIPALALVIVLVVLRAGPVCAAGATTGDDKPAVQLIVADGQLRSHPFLVFITHEITPAMKPRLMFRGAHLALPAAELEKSMLTPLRVAPDQLRTIRVAGVEITTRGTLLIFDLSQYEIPWFKSGVRLLPMVEWTETGSDGRTSVVRQAVAGDEVFLGNMIGAALWTGLVLLAVLAALLTWSRAKSDKVTTFEPRPLLLLITGPDGYLSLWRTQLMLWTFAVGGVVFLFGLVRLRIPEIPDTLVALMGLSLLTGGLSATRARQDAQAKVAKGVSLAAPAAGGDKPRGVWADLIASWNDASAQVELSVPKAQMVIWTVLILGLFIVKSILEGALWEVPWQMVAFTGVSQAGYIGDKYVKSMVPVGR